MFSLGCSHACVRCGDCAEVADSASSVSRKYHCGEENSLWHCSVVKEMWFAVSHSLWYCGRHMEFLVRTSLRKCLDS